ncbi:MULTISPECIES: alcohol dehydrogenase catalytic domain-containing protein [unclassified Streptomyces]|uniref:alcohol dehydrogenase catalytic domain-containing protein n=1 Tax=unclassified Streptomyces TaxID=2593676 RepID=UPI0004C68F2F|nr:MULTISPECIES: alcohol dehydrogenase catalytic domain-containing protein [unclassified Streptomyces]
MATYRAVEVAPDGGLRLTERDLVPPGPGQVRVRVEACGICHSDSIAVRPHDEGEPGRVPGHEAVGRIDALGEGVTGWSVGGRVGVGFLGGHCGVCAECRLGDFVGCTDQPYTGVHVDGGYAEYMYARQTGLVAVPEEMSATRMAPLLCAGFTVYNALVDNVRQPGGLVAGDLVAVQGIGGLGHLALQYARALALRVVAVARGADKEELALRLGAHHYVDSKSMDAAERLTELGGARMVLGTAAGGDVSPLLAGLARRGRLVLVGVSPEPVRVAPRQLIFDAVQVSGSLTGTPAENEQNLVFAQAHDVAPMVERTSLADAQAAYDRMLRGEARFRMVIGV